jgi:adenosine deaminase
VGLYNRSRGALDSRKSDVRSVVLSRRFTCDVSFAMKLEKQLLQSLPKVLLHEHLDGVLRPRTVIELARDGKYAGLPTEDPDALSQWFFRGANQGSLAKYLEGFAHTIAVMQTEEALQRVAYEQAEDLSQDGVVYFETRFAPVFHPKKGLTHQQIVAAVLKGLDRGRKDFGISSGLIICAVRNMNTSLEMAELAVDFRERGVVGLRSGGRRRRLSGEETCRRFSLHSAGELQHHDSRRRRLRKRIDLAGHSVLRGSPHRARDAADR